MLLLLFSPSRWTPPIPPVTNTGIPALCAAIMVPATVVPPDKPCHGEQPVIIHALCDQGNCMFIGELSAVAKHSAATSLQVMEYRYHHLFNKHAGKTKNINLQ